MRLQGAVNGRASRGQYSRVVDSLTVAPPAPRIRLRDPALDHRPIRVEALPDGHETDLVETPEHGQIRGREGSVVHVEVVRRMVNVRTSIIGRPRPSTGGRRAQPPTPSTAKSRRRVTPPWIEVDGFCPLHDKGAANLGVRHH